MVKIIKVDGQEVKSELKFTGSLKAAQALLTRKGYAFTKHQTCWVYTKDGSVSYYQIWE